MKTALLLFFFFMSCNLAAPAQTPTYSPAYVLGNTLNDPFDLVIGDDGLIYVADSHATRVFDTSGNYKNELYLNYADPNFPEKKLTDYNRHYRISRDKDGNCYILTSFSGTVQKINPAGETILHLGERGNLPGQFEYPQGIVVDQEGFIYIADTRNHRIQKFDQQGNVVFVIGSLGAEPGQFNMPTQLALNEAGNLYVVDSNNKRIQVLNKEGGFIKQIVSDTSTVLFHPSDVALDKQGNIYITDVGAYRVIKFDTEGDLISSFGSKGSGKGQMTSPLLSIAVDDDGYIYVAESSYPTRIQKFSPGGVFLLSFGDPSTEDRLINYPVAAESDATGNFFVADHITGLVKKFNKYGQHYFTFGGRADVDGEFKDYIRDMAIDRNGDVYVLAPDVKGSVQKFSSRGEFISRFAPSNGSTTVTPTAPAEPGRIAIDHEGNIYISDQSYLYKYNPAGVFVTRITFINNETESPIIFSDNDFNGINFNIDNTGQLYILLRIGIKKYNLNGDYISDFIPADHPYGISALGIDFDAENNIYLTEDGYKRGYLIKCNSTTGAIMGISSFHDNLISYQPSVNASGTRVYIRSIHRTLTCFTINTEGDSTAYNRISGTVYLDQNKNCLKDMGEKGMAGVIVEATPGPYYALSDKDGNYTLEVESGSYNIASILPAGTNMVGKKTEACTPEQHVSFTSIGNTSLNHNFGNKVTLSPYLYVSVSSDRRRRCFESTTKLTYSNTGYAPANNAKVYLQLPVQVELLSADKPYTRLPNGTYVFEAGTVAAGKTSVITIQDKVVCGDESIRGMTVCTKVWITPGNQSPTAPPAPVISITGTCNAETGKVRFVIKNTGQVDMEESEQFRKYINGLLSTVEDYRLAAGDSMVLWVPAGGRTVRLEADQPDGNGDNTMASMTVEACSTLSTPTAFSTGFVNTMPSDDEEAEVAEECLPIIDSFDPNDKLVLPVGRTEENYTPTGVALKYKIRFQNTGTDVAYRVVVVDTLSEHLDLSTLQIGSASHTYRYELSGKGKPVLTWTFDNIMLPDSTSNEPGSHGYIQFSIKPKADLPEKTAVENFADIFFDYNSPVRTNVTINHIYDMPLVIDETVLLNLEQIIATPAITSFTPAAGKPGTEVTLNGKRFSATAASNKVYFNGLLAPVVSASETELKVLVPASAVTGTLQIVTPDGVAGTTETFEVYQPPVFNGFSPAEGIVGATVTLQGEQLTSDLLQTVTLGSKLCEIISNTSNTFVVRVPAEAVTATFKIMTKGGEAESASEFVVWHQPSISGLSNPKDTVGATISIEGAHFAPAARNSVMFGQAQAQVLQATPAQLTVKIPVGATSGFVTVETPGGKATSVAYFEVIPAPVFLSMTPSKGSVGTAVEITGANFGVHGVQDEIYFNGVKALLVEASDAMYKVRVPRGATTGRVKLTGVGGVAYSTTNFVVEELTPTQSIKVYPNPTTGHFTISFLHADFDVQAVQVYSTVGKFVHSTAVSSPRPDKLEMQVAFAQAGLYILQIQTDKGIVMKKLTVL
ncbi:DUF7619 domain-containing protein [Pontibacter pamirensis]|uniref:DUF7619 domain-containing protein n=1 Tax=Pontibacter pamirensis TaxID=2562824 RepID=UPI001389F109|nr:IPT/TIG domain-containing protein [Pontibacter pamirensis]